jgi:hypothetical protein
LLSLAESWRCSFWFLGTLLSMSSSVILVVEVRTSWIVVHEFQWSSSSFPSPGCKSSSCAWSIVLVRLKIFHVVDVSRILGLRSPSHFSVALSHFISFSHSFVMIIVRQDIFFKFMKKFINCLWFLSRQVQSCWSWSQTLDQCLNRCFVVRLRNLGSLLHDSSDEVP